MVKRNLIVLEKDIVSVIRHTGKLEYIKKEGEYEFPISVDFWNWWKKALSYLPDEDELDICFVYDKEYDLLSEEFYMNAKKVEKNESIWNVEYIKTFFWKT